MSGDTARLGDRAAYDAVVPEEQQLSEDRESLQSLLDSERVIAEVREEIGAITASADSGAAYILVIWLERSGTDAWQGACAALGGLAALKGVNKLNDIRKRRTVRVTDGEIGADVTDVPSQALVALAHPPPAPSTELEWRVNRQSWADAFGKDTLG